MRRHDKTLDFEKSRSNAVKECKEAAKLGKTPACKRLIEWFYGGDNYGSPYCPGRFQTLLDQTKNLTENYLDYLEQPIKIDDKVFQIIDYQNFEYLWDYEHAEIGEESFIPEMVQVVYKVDGKLMRLISNKESWPAAMETGPNKLEEVEEAEVIHAEYRVIN